LTLTEIKKPVYHHPKGIMVLLAHKYKLNSVCNAELFPLAGYPHLEFQPKYAQKSITGIA